MDLTKSGQQQVLMRYPNFIGTTLHISELEQRSSPCDSVKP